MSITKKDTESLDTSLRQWRLLSMALTGGLVACLTYILVQEITRTPSIEAFSSQYPHIDPARHIIRQENFVVNLQPLRDTVNALVQEFGRDSVSVYIEYLNTGANISINPDTYIWPASLAKLPLAMAVMKKIETGDWQLSDKLVLMDGDRNDESGNAENPLDEYPIGTAFTIETLLKESLMHSDNTAFYILQRNLHEDEVTRIVDELGLEALFSQDGKVSAKEYSRLFRSLYTASFLDREHSELLLAWLSSSSFNDFAGQSIPDDVDFAHKYGEKITMNVYADSGIVYLENRPYLITILVQGDASIDFVQERERAARFMQLVSREAYEFFSQDNSHADL